MGILHNAIEYIKDWQSGHEGFLTRYEELYPHLPRPARCLTSGKAEIRRDNDQGEQIHQTK